MLKFKINSENLITNKQLRKVFKDNVAFNICFSDKDTLVGELRHNDTRKGLDYIGEVVQSLKVTKARAWLLNKDNNKIIQLKF